MRKKGRKVGRKNERREGNGPGTVCNLRSICRSVSGGSIHVYRIIHGGTGLELIHRTAVDEIPYAIHSFQNKVCVRAVVSVCVCVFVVGWV